MFGPSRLFISYRRSDAEASAGRLFEALKARFGVDSVFFDTASIPYGEDFQRLVRERIAASDVVLVVIGPSWLSSSNERGRRLDQQDDPVRFELRTALDNGKRIVPVLTAGAAAPQQQALPEALRALAELNMPTLRDASFDIDFNALVHQLQGRTPDAVEGQIGAWRRLKAAATGWPLAAALVTLALLAAAWTSFFDLLNLDTHVQRWLLAAGGPNRGEPVLLVGIDAASERELGRDFDAAQAADWRRDHARLIDRAAQAGAAAVAFDMFFESATEADAVLAEAVQRAAQRTPPLRVVFGVRQSDAGAPVLIAPLRREDSWGSLCLLDRGGGALWSAPLAVLRPAVARSGELIAADTPALALAAVVGQQLLEADASRRELRFDGPTRNPPVRFSAVERQRLDRLECRTTRPGDDQLTLLLRVAAAGHWRAAPRHVSYAQALDAQRTPDDRFTGRVVLVGLTALERAGANPDVHVVRDRFTPRTVFGVELQADAIATLAGGRVPQLPTADRQLLTTLAACLVGGGAALWLYRRPAWVRRGALLGVSFLWLMLSWWLARHDVLLYVIHDLAALWLAAGALRAVQWLARRFQAFRRISP